MSIRILHRPITWIALSTVAFAGTSFALSAQGSLMSGLPDTALLTQEHPSSPKRRVYELSKDAVPIQPLMPVQLTDPSIVFDGEQYILTGTRKTQRHGTGIWLWSSLDLQSWTELGQVIADEVFFQSPEIHFHGDQYWIVACGTDGSVKLYRSETDQVEGPYEKLADALVEDAVTPSLFFDGEDVYLLWGKGLMGRLASDFQSIEGDVMVLKPSAEILDQVSTPMGKDILPSDRVGQSGAFLRKIDDLYYLFGNEITGRMRSATDDVFVAVSEQLEGPYSPRYLAIPHAGQTTLFEDNAGRLMATFSPQSGDDYVFFHERPGVVALEFSKHGLLRPDGSLILENSIVATAQKPLPEVPLRDPSITVGRDGRHYLVGTNIGYGVSKPKGGVKLWSSPDLEDWTDEGFIIRWDDLDPEIPEGNQLWAPEICYVKQDKTFYLTFSIWNKHAGSGPVPREGHTFVKGSTRLYRSTSGEATGPYENVTEGAFVQGIDGFIFEDDDALYYLWAHGKLGKLNAERNGFEGEVVELKDLYGYYIGYEGPSMVKWKDKYLWFAADWNGPLRREGTYDLMVGVADQIEGPYTQAVVAVPHGGHGSAFYDRDGHLKTTFFGNDFTAPHAVRLAIHPFSIEWLDLLISGQPFSNLR